MKYVEIRSLPPEVQARMLKLLRRRGAIVSEAESRRVARAQRARGIDQRVSQPTETGDDSSER